VLTWELCGVPSYAGELLGPLLLQGLLSIQHLYHTEAPNGHLKAQDCIEWSA
jgi:hypothetical protein